MRSKATIGLGHTGAAAQVPTQRVGLRRTRAVVAQATAALKAPATDSARLPWRSLLLVRCWRRTQSTGITVPDRACSDHNSDCVQHHVRSTRYGASIYALFTVPRCSRLPSVLGARDTRRETIRMRQSIYERGDARDFELAESGLVWSHYRFISLWLPADPEMAHGSPGALAVGMCGAEFGA
jgi:hypothetical protein